MIGTSPDSGMLHKILCRVYANSRRLFYRKKHMNETTENKNGNCEKCCSCDYTLAFLVLRLWLAMRGIVTGLEKFGAYKSVQQPLIDPNTGQPDASGAMVDVKLKYYALGNYSGVPAGLKGKFANEALLPKFALTAFDHILGPLLIATGVMLLIGLGTRLSLFVQGLIYVALTVGLILIHQDDGISWLGIHVALVAFALTLAKYNKLALLKKW
jgi:thiosulfate dehydrogenase (quinone) large subunit